MISSRFATTTAARNGMSKMIKEIRNWANEKGRKYGNKIHDGLGDYLADTKINVTKPLITGLAALCIIPAMAGCSTTPNKKQAQKTQELTAEQKIAKLNKSDAKRLAIYNHFLEKSTQRLQKTATLEAQKRMSDRNYQIRKAGLEKDALKESYTIPKFGELFPEDGSVSDVNLEDYTKIFENLDEDGKAKESEKFFHIYAGFEYRTPEKVRCKVDVDDMETLCLKNITLALGQGRGFGYLTIGSSNSTEVKNSDTGLEYSKFTGKTSTGMLGGQYNFVNLENWKIGAFGHLVANHETMDGYSVDSITGKRNFKEETDCLGAGLGLEAEWTPNPYFGVFARYGWNWYDGDSGSAATSRENSLTYGLKAKIPF